MKHDTIGIIYYQKQNGQLVKWCVSAHPQKDNPKTLREHFMKHIGMKNPEMTFIKAEIVTQPST